MKDGLKVIIVIILFVLAGVFIFAGARVHVFGLPVSVGVLWLAMRNLPRPGTFESAAWNVTSQQR